MNLGDGFNSFKGQIQNKVDSLSSKVQDVRGPGSSAENSSTVFPSRWNSTFIDDGAPEGKDMFFRFMGLNAQNFNKSFGYELWIKDAKTGDIKAKYQFPINPQSVQYSTNPSTVLESTMKGIYENHNGAVFRPITVSGTTGTMPLVSRQVTASSSDLRRSLEYAFKNTIQAVNRTVNQVDRTINAFSGATQKFEGPLNNKATVVSDISNQSGFITGFQAIHDLDRFLDYYLSSKKLSQNRSWRLYFINNRDEKYHAVSLGPYSITKGAGTTEYQYTINMTAYRREATLPVGTPARNVFTSGSAAGSKNTLSNILNGLRQARTAVASAHGVLAGIRSDVNESLIQPVGEAVLLVKDLLGLQKSMYDFAFSGETTKAMEESFKQYFTDHKPDMQQVAASISNIGLVGAVTNEGKSESAIVTSAQDKLASGKAEQFQDETDSSDPIKVLFNAPANYPDIFEEFPIDDMNLPSEILEQLDTSTDTVLSFTADDIVTRRDKIVDFSRSISEALGGGSQSYNTVKGLNTVKKTYKKLSVDDIVLLNHLNNMAICMDQLTSLLDISASNDADDYYRFYADYAVAAGLRFNQGNLSKFFVPFPVGGSLEMLAAQYLGSPERWIEIAALNALKAPYVDEEGYEILVTASAGGDTLTVADTENLYIGQVVEVVSDLERATRRKVRSIDIVSSIETIVTFETVEGRPLTAYRPSQNARIRAFMPNTVNSDMLIAIPSSAPANFQTTFKTSPEVDELNGIARIAKIDFLLDSNGDLIFTGGGDIRLAYGMTNLIQAAIMKIRTRTGQIISLPNYGNPAEAGQNTAEVEPVAVLKAINQSFQTDPRFSGIIAGEVQKTGVALNVSILVGISNTQVTLPVSASVPR